MHAQSDKWFPFCLFFLVFGIGSCFGWQTGYAINLARDFGPRLMSYAVGYPSEVWSAGGYYFWVLSPSYATCFPLRPPTDLPIRFLWSRPS